MASPGAASTGNGSVTTVVAGLQTSLFGRHVLARSTTERLSNQELEPSGARGPSVRASAGASAAAKEELGLCGCGHDARGSIPAR